MARPYKLYEQALARMAGEKAKINNKSSRRQKTIERSEKPKAAPYPDEQQNGSYNFNFPNELMTKRELAEKTGVPSATIKDFIKRNHLKPIQLPGYHYKKFSPKHLERLILNYNHLLIFLFCLLNLFRAAIMPIVKPRQKRVEIKRVCVVNNNLLHCQQL